jgi:hypothetical protein
VHWSDWLIGARELREAVLTVSFDDFAFAVRDVVNPTRVDLMSRTEETLPSVSSRSVLSSWLTSRKEERLTR